MFHDDGPNEYLRIETLLNASYNESNVGLYLLRSSRLIKVDKTMSMQFKDCSEALVSIILQMFIKLDWKCISSFVGSIDEIVCEQNDFKCVMNLGIRSINKNDDCG